eukprot:scaffold70521_cov50-Phaeocystis_antarctica.AAC.2
MALSGRLGAADGAGGAPRGGRRRWRGASGAVAGCRGASGALAGCRASRGGRWGWRGASGRPMALSRSSTCTIPMSGSCRLVRSSCRIIIVWPQTWFQCTRAEMASFCLPVGPGAP